MKTDKISYYFKRNKMVLSLLVISGVIFNGFTGLVPVYQGRLIDNFKSLSEIRYLMMAASQLIILVVFLQANRFLKRYSVRLLANNMAKEMREISYLNLLKQPLDTMRTLSKGDILNQNINDVTDATEGIRKVITEIFDSGVLLVANIVVLTTLDKTIAIIILSNVLVVVLIAYFLNKWVKKSVVQYKKTMSEAKEITVNVIRNEIYYSSAGIHSFFQDEFIQSQNKLEKKAKVYTILQDSLEPIFKSLAFLASVVVIMIGLNKVIDQQYTIGTFSAIIATYLVIADKTSRVTKIFSAYQKAQVSWRRCQPYLKPINKQVPYSIDTSNQLTITNLKFQLDASCQIKLKQLTALNNTLIGICGPVHSGKSTLAAVFTGLYPYQGNIMLDNRELSDFQAEAIENLVGYVGSNVGLFHTTIKENILLGYHGDYQQAAQDAMLAKEIEQLPSGYDTTITHSTANLSGGQQKRLGIARALVRKPQIILLDDPFSAVEEAMALEILTNIKQHYPQAITFVVTNNQNILKMMDQIIYLRKDQEAIVDQFEKLQQRDDFKQLMQGVTSDERL